MSASAKFVLLMESKQRYHRVCLSKESFFSKAKESQQQQRSASLLMCYDTYVVFVDVYLSTEREGEEHILHNMKRVYI